ncbi:7182_t:CDS:1, partial [Ambispora gerdemannii]
ELHVDINILRFVKKITAGVALRLLMFANCFREIIHIEVIRQPLKYSQAIDDVETYK